MRVRTWVSEGERRPELLKERGRAKAWATESENLWGSYEGWGLSRLRTLGWRGPPLLMTLGGWEERSRQVQVLG